MAKAIPDAYRLNRLNLTNMVDSQLKELKPVTEVFFNSYTITTNSASEKEPTPKPKTSIATSFNSIVASMHSKLRPSKLSPPSAPAIPAPIAETIKQDQAKVQRSEKDAAAAGATKQRSCVCSRNYMPNNTKALPQVTLTLERKIQERLHRCAPLNGANFYTAQQRAREICRQKRMLEEMLDEHDKLKRDRQTMAVEIQSMRNYLNEIRQRLDVSLRKLNSNKTLSEQSTRLKKPLPPRLGISSHNRKPNNSKAPIRARNRSIGTDKPATKAR